MNVNTDGVLSLLVALFLTAGGPPGARQTSQSATMPPSALTSAPAASGGPMTGAVGETQIGLAAYYGDRFQSRRTASGERFDSGALTTAHRTLPFGTKVRVTNVKNNRSVVLRVNDRGPTPPDRIVGMSPEAAERLGFVRSGLTEVTVEVVEVSPKG